MKKNTIMEDFCKLSRHDFSLQGSLKNNKIQVLLNLNLMPKGEGAKKIKTYGFMFIKARGLELNFSSDS